MVAMRYMSRRHLLVYLYALYFLTHIMLELIPSVCLFAIELVFLFPFVGKEIYRVK